MNQENEIARLTESLRLAQASVAGLQGLVTRKDIELAQIKAVQAPIQSGELPYPAMVKGAFDYYSTEQMRNYGQALWRQALAEADLIHKDLIKTMAESALAARPATPSPVQAQSERAMPAQFGEWFKANYPADTILHDPEWHAPKIYWRAIALQDKSVAAAPSQPVAVPEAAQQNGGLVRAALIDLIAIENYALGQPLDAESQRDLMVRFARARKALAAVPEARELTDADIVRLYRESFNAMVGRLREAPRHVPDTVLDFARAIERHLAGATPAQEG